MSPKKAARKRIVLSPPSESRSKSPDKTAHKRVVLSPSSPTPRHGTNPFYELADNLQSLMVDLREYGEMSDDICARWRNHPLDRVYIPDDVLHSLPYRNQLKTIHKRLYGEELNFSRDFGLGRSCT